MWTTVTRRTPTSTCATCRNEHACTLCSVLCHSHLSHPLWLKTSLSLPPSSTCHPCVVVLDSLRPLLFTSTCTSPSFSCPSSPCTPTTLTPWLTTFATPPRGATTATTSPLPPTIQKMPSEVQWMLMPGSCQAAVQSPSPVLQTSSRRETSLCNRQVQCCRSRANELEMREKKAARRLQGWAADESAPDVLGAREWRRARRHHQTCLSRGVPADSEVQNQIRKDGYPHFVDATKLKKCGNCSPRAWQWEKVIGTREGNLACDSDKKKMKYTVSTWIKEKRRWPPNDAGRPNAPRRGADHTVVWETSGELHWRSIPLTRQKQTAVPSLRPRWKPSLRLGGHRPWTERHTLQLSTRRRSSVRKRKQSLSSAEPVSKLHDHGARALSANHHAVAFAT